MPSAIAVAAVRELCLLRGWRPGMSRPATEALFTPEEWAGMNRALNEPRRGLTWSALATETWDDPISMDERTYPPE